MNDQDSGDRRQAAGHVGWAVRGLFFGGTLSLIVACLALFVALPDLGEGPRTGGLLDVGVCLIAAALSFGLLLNGLLRN